jgi:hypothetical protein
VRSLDKFLGEEMLPVRADPRDMGRGLRLGSGVLKLPWPRRWAFRRKHVRDDETDPSFKNYVIVGSWKIAPEPLNEWIAAAEATARMGLERERTLSLYQGLDLAPIPRGFKIAILPPGRNWMEPVEPDVHLLIAGALTEFPALDPEAAAPYLRSLRRAASTRLGPTGA